jgi:glycosyltransferase involved in cell wall biosynthesis
MTAKVTIIMATYNRSQFILESILSIQNQTYDNWECLIIDDGGTDSTAEVLKPILETDSRFQYLVRPENYQKGLPGSRNYGLDLVQGDYIIFFDDDDIAHPQNLELCVKELSNEAISFCRYIRDVFIGDFDYAKFDYSTKYNSFSITEKDIVKILRFELPFNSCAIMWKASCFHKNRYVEHLMYAEEWELYPRIISNGFTGISIGKTLFYGRKHPKSNTGEFYNNDVVRRESFAEAILLVIQNLKEKDKLTNPIIHYFVQISLDYKYLYLFKRIESILDLKILQSVQLKLFYMTLTLRLFIYRRLKKK